MVVFLSLCVPELVCLLRHHWHLWVQQAAGRAVEAPPDITRERRGA